MIERAVLLWLTTQGISCEQPHAQTRDGINSNRSAYP
mgnify:FL=1